MKDPREPTGMDRKIALMRKIALDSQVSPKTRFMAKDAGSMLTAIRDSEAKKGGRGVNRRDATSGSRRHGI